MSDVPLLLLQVTVHRGMFWFHDQEYMGYSADPDTAHDISFHAPMLPHQLKNDHRYIGLGAIRVHKRIVTTVELPLKTPSRSAQTVEVAPDWILRMRPLLVEAYRVHKESPLVSFTLLLDGNNTIIRAEAERRSIPPQKE